MKTAKTLLVILSGFLFFAAAAHTEQTRSGTERGMTTPPKTAPNTNIKPAPTQAVPGLPAPMPLKPEPRPLKDILKITVSPPLCDSIPQAVDKMVKTRDELVYAIYSATLNTPKVNFSLQSRQMYASYVKDQCCSQNKNFSLQEQQAAGCAGSDTVNLCMVKLIKHCISNVEKLQLPDIKDYLKGDMDEFNLISIKSKQLSDQMKYLLSIMP